MKALVQRVSSSSVTVDNKVVGKIAAGYMILLGVCKGDSEKDVKKLTSKILSLRIFEDNNGKMNKSITDINGQILLISQFTLCARNEKGNRPSFIDAAEPTVALKFYDQMKKMLNISVHTESGVFGAMMSVSLVNDGPTTILLDTDS